MTRNRGGFSKRELRARRRRQRERKHWLAVGLGIAAIELIATFALRSQPTAPPVSAARLADDPSLGPADAPVTIVEYGDFGCPSCRTWHNAGILPRIQKEYGNQIRFVWRDFPIIMPQSPKAAAAAQCAYDQGKFWQYHDILYARAPALSVGNLKSYAVELGLDTAQFDQCLDSGKHRTTVQHDLQDAESRGFPGTPSFLINDQLFVGPLSAQFLEQKIDAILNSAG